MRWLALVLVAAGAAACIKVPEFSQKDAAPSDGTGSDSSDGAIELIPGATVTTTLPHTAELAGLYKMAFSMQGFHFPFAWGIGPGPADENRVSVLNGGPGGCEFERDFGVAFFPAHNFTSTDGTATELLSDITVELVGPPIARVRLDYRANKANCNGLLVGRSIFTFFPDGRISRMDAAYMPQAESSNACTCGPTFNWVVTTFTTFSQAVIDAVRDNAGSEILPPGAGNNVDLAGAIPCIEGFGATPIRLGIGWHNAAGGTRMRNLDGNAFAMVGDMLPASAGTIGGGGDNGLVGDTTTTYWPSLDATCATLRARILPHTDSTPAIRLDNTIGTASTVGLAQDGTFGGETAQDSVPGYEPLNSMFTIRSGTAGAQAAFALWVNFGTAASDAAPVVLKNGSAGTGSWYSVQRPVVMGANHYLFWFPDGITATDVIEIRAQ